jgi:type IV pilus assembly protein PilX
MKEVNPMTATIATGKSPQRGATLIICLVILFVMTIVGVSSARTTLLQEKMVGNLRDKSLAFQAAEAALREGELWIDPQSTAPDPVSSCEEPPCSLWQLNATALADVENKNRTWWASNANEFGNDGSAEFNDSVTDPRYVLEEYNSSPKSFVIGKGKTNSTHKTYRVTAIGYGGSETTKSVLESLYAKEYFGH